MKWSKIKNSNEIPIELSNENLCVVVHKGGRERERERDGFGGDSQATDWKGCLYTIPKKWTLSF